MARHQRVGKDKRRYRIRPWWSLPFLLGRVSDEAFVNCKPPERLGFKSAMGHVLPDLLTS